MAYGRTNAGTNGASEDFEIAALSKMGTSPDYGVIIRALAEDENYIYAGGATTKTIRKYNKSDLSYVAESPNYGGIIRALAEDNNYIYAGGNTTKTISRYNKQKWGVIKK